MSTIPATIPTTPLSESSPASEQIRELLDSFLSGKSERTLRAYRGDLQDFAAYVEARILDDAARTLLGQGHGPANALVLRYRAALMDRGLAPATINRRLAALRSLVKLARTIGLVPWALEVGNVKSKAYRDTRGPGIEGFRSLLRRLAKRGGDPKERRDRAILRLLFDLALRRGEVVRLDREDVDLDQRTISIIGKGQTEPEPLTLPEPTTEALRDWIEVRGEDPGPLFPTFDRARKGSGRLSGRAVGEIVKKLGRDVGLRVTPHGLRHTAITEAVKLAQAHGIDLEEVLDFSRHADVSTLMIYRDRERNVQGQLAGLVATAAES